MPSVENAMSLNDCLVNTSVQVFSWVKQPTFQIYFPDWNRRTSMQATALWIVFRDFVCPDSTEIIRGNQWKVLEHIVKQPWFNEKRTVVQCFPYITDLT